MKHLLSFVSVFLIISTLITGVMYFQSQYHLDNSKEKFEKVHKSYIYNKKHPTNKVQKKLKENLKKLENEYNTKTQYKDEIIEKTKYYIDRRYSYNGKTIEQSDKIVSAVKDVCDTDFVKSLRNFLNQATAGNGGVSDDFKHTYKILDMYVSKPYTADKSNDVNAEKNYKATYLCDVYLRMEYNIENTAVSHIIFQKTDKGWIIIYENIEAVKFYNEGV